MRPMGRLASGYDPGVSEIAQRYDHNAERYDDVTAYNRDAANRLVATLPAGDYERLLDVGCGTGYATLAMLERFAPRHVTGVDVSAQMIERFRAKLADHPEVDLTLTVGDVRALPVSDASFDCVLASMMLHWIADRPAAIAAMAGALAPGGVLGIVAPGPGHDAEYATLLRGLDPPVPHQVSDVFRTAQVFPDATEAALRASGLEIVDVWVEHRHRCVDPDRYMARITAVGSHVWTELMGLDAATRMIDRITDAVHRASGPAGWEYTFTKTYAIARRPEVARR